MAKVKYGAMVTDARGSIDGVVYSKSQYGAYVGVKVSPQQPRTVNQLAARQILSGLAKLWGSTLNDSQRAAWKVWSAAHTITDVFGNSQTLSAIAAYCRVNAVIAHAGGTRIDDPPATFASTPLDTLSVSMAESGQTCLMAFTASPAATNDVLYIFATPRLQPGRSFYKNELRYIGSSSPAVTTPYDAAPQLFARFPAASVAGDKYAFVVATADQTTGAVAVGLSQVVTVT